MTKIYYGKEKYVPDQCPVCGSVIVPPEGRTTFPGLLKAYYGAWHKGKDIYQPRWEGIVRWFGRCGQCMITAQLSEPHPLVKLLARDDFNYTRSITVPFNNKPINKFKRMIRSQLRRKFFD